MICSRANQDLAIRNVILSGNGVVEYSLTDKQKQFWQLFAVGMKLKPPKFIDRTMPLEPYTFQHSSCLMFSHGLESTLIKHMWNNLPLINVEDHVEWTNPIEGALAIVGAGLGYGTTFYGQELDSERANIEVYDWPGFFYESSQQFRDLWKQYSGADFLSPFVLHRKHELAGIADREQLDYYSCENSTIQWCGNCFKCLQQHLISEMFGYKVRMVLVEDPDKIYAALDEEQRNEIEVEWQHHKTNL